MYNKIKIKTSFLKKLIRVAVIETKRWLQARVDCYLYVLVQTKRWIVDPLGQFAERHGSVRLVIHEIGQSKIVQVQEDADDAALLAYAVINTVQVLAVVHEPGALRVDVHAPGLVVLTEHVLFGYVVASDTKRRVWLIVVAVHGDFPVVQALGEADRAQDDAVFEAFASCGHVVVAEENVVVGGLWIEGEPECFDEYK